MMNKVIEIQSLGKSYVISHGETQPYVALRDVLTEAPKRLVNSIGINSNPSYSKELFWALKNVTFSVNKGEKIGVIGRNGAGKSTLLKILSRITEPTEGKVKIQGKVSSLLEIGTGFHPELTGRENVFLNGAVLGMSRKEIQRKFDEIVAFAEIEQFLDTPVKRYSSGMQVRLGFAVAAHLEPEILLIDEVLAVGDVAFQKKSIGKMKEVSKSGRTILFVSHNTEAIQNLCQKCVLLSQGKLVDYGPTKKIVDKYLSSLDDQSSVSLGDRLDRRGNGRIVLKKTWTEDSRGRKSSSFSIGDKMTIKATVSANQSVDLSTVRFFVGISTITGYYFTLLTNDYSGFKFKGSLKNKATFSCTIPRIPFHAGTYFYDLAVKENEKITDYVKQVGSFKVSAGDYYGGGVVKSGKRLLMMDHQMTVDY